MKVKSTYQELENRIKELETNQYKSNIVDLESSMVTAKGNKPKKDEQELKDSNERWKTLFRDIPNVAVQGYDKNGKTIYWNKASETFYGYTSEEAIGIHLIDLIIPEELKSPVRDAIKDMFTTKASIPAGELKLKRKDGSSIFVFSSHSYVQVPGREPEMYCLDIDLSERKQSEQALEESEEKYRETVKLLAEGISFVSLDEEFILVNEAAEKIFEVNKGELVGKNISEFFNDEEFEKIKNATVKSKQNIHNSYEAELITKTGNNKYIKVSTTPKFDNDNNFIGTFGVFHDITEKKNLEIELKSHRENLEALVYKRTEELEEQNKKLDEAVLVFVGREQKIKELKETVRKLEDKIINQ